MTSCEVKTHQNAISFWQHGFFVTIIGFQTFQPVREQMNMRVMRRPASDSLTKSNSPELRNLEQKRDCTLSNTLQFETAKTRAKCSTAFYWRGKGEVRNQTTAQVGLSIMKRLGMLLLFLGKNTSPSQIILSTCPGFRQSAHIIYI